MYITTTKLYSAVKQNEIIKFVGKWMELGNNILIEVIPTQKTDSVLLLVNPNFESLGLSVQPVVKAGARKRERHPGAISKEGALERGW